MDKFETKMKMVTTAEIQIYDRDGKPYEHFKVDENGMEEKIE
jgi:hypothetical protein